MKHSAFIVTYSELLFHERNILCLLSAVFTHLKIVKRLSVSETMICVCSWC